MCIRDSTTTAENDSLNLIFYRINSSMRNIILGGDVIPQKDGTWNLGTSSIEWNDLHLDGVAYVDDIHAADCDIDGGTIDGTILGQSDAASANVTTLGVSLTATITGQLNANGGIACDSDKFTVADTTGDVLTKGTLEVQLSLIHI